MTEATLKKLSARRKNPSLGLRGDLTRRRRDERHIRVKLEAVELPNGGDTKRKAV